jgi:glycosyltransferase involved in cell wall biosynthesis
VWRTFPDTRFLLVGDGPERQNLARRIASLERPEQVRLLGWREDARDLIAAFDVFVLPSLWEGLNLSLLTACALGRGVVATHLRSNREIVEPGVTGLLPAPERAVLEADCVDPDRLGQAIGALLADPDGRRRMGEAAARRTRARFGAEMMAARHEELYRRLLHRSARGQGAALGGAPWRARGSRATAAGDGGL